MTLNITVLTGHTIYQSADFRLTDLRTRAVLSDSSDKVVSLVYKSWSGFVTYTGIGSLSDGTSVATLLARWLDGIHDISIQEVAELIRNRGTGWLQEIFENSQPRKHTFLLAGFIGIQPKMYVISNFERWQGLEDGRISRSFATSEVGYRGGTKVVVTGCKSAIPRTARKFLERTIQKHRDDPSRVRSILTEANRTAAPKSGGTVSPECSVYSFDLEGTGRAARPDHVVGAAPQILRGFNVSGAVLKIAKEIFRTTRVSVRTLGVGRSGNKGLKLPCKGVITIDVPSGYRMREIIPPGWNTVFPRALNNRGQIVGEASVARGAPSLPFIWTKDSWALLTVPPGSYGYARDINDLGDIVGGCVTPATRHLEHAWFWASSGESRDLDGRLDQESSACALNGRSEIVGRIRQGYRQTQSQDNAPVIWRSPKQQPERIPLPAGQWGEAVDVSEHGDVLVSARVGEIENHAALWTAMSDKVDILDYDGHPVTPISIDRTGRFVVGSIGGDGKVVLRDRQEARWSIIDCPPHYFPKCVNARGDTVGTFRSEEGYRPWIRLHGKSVRMLPCLTFHDTIPSGINDNGIIVGTCTADHGVHALIWEPECDTE